MRPNVSKFSTASVLLCLVAALLVATLPSTPAQSLTGEDVLDQMNADERFGYLAGSVEMAAFLAGQQGDSDRATCIMDWYYRGGDGTVEVVALLTEFKDRQAMPVIHVAIRRACGE